MGGGKRSVCGDEEYPSCLSGIKQHRECLHMQLLLLVEVPAHGQGGFAAPPEAGQ